MTPLLNLTVAALSAIAPSSSVVSGMPQRSGIALPSLTPSVCFSYVTGLMLSRRHVPDEDTEPAAVCAERRFFAPYRRDLQLLIAWGEGETLGPCDHCLLESTRSGKIRRNAAYQYEDAEFAAACVEWPFFAPCGLPE